MSDFIELHRQDGQPISLAKSHITAFGTTVPERAAYKVRGWVTTVAAQKFETVELYEEIKEILSR